MSLLDFMRGYAASNPLRLHTPGHKGKAENGETDITELVDGSFPGPQLEAAQKRIAQVYGAKHARLLAGGSSQGVKAAIYFAGGNGIADRNSHRSVFDGFRLAGKSVAVVGTSDIRPIEVGDIEKAITPDTRVVVVTSPTYFGYAADIVAIKDMCTRRGLILAVDGAHGAHFGFGKHLPSGFCHIPDICNVSAHKTLGAMTGGAILFDGLPESEHAALVESADIMGSTSPSYPILASVEQSVYDAAKNYAKRYDSLYPALEQARREACFLENDDFTRLTLDCRAQKVCADELMRELCARGVYAELVAKDYIVFLFTAADTPIEVERFSTALRQSLKACAR